MPLSKRAGYVRREEEEEKDTLRRRKRATVAEQAQSAEERERDAAVQTEGFLATGEMGVTRKGLSDRGGGYMYCTSK